MLSFAFFIGVVPVECQKSSPNLNNQIFQIFQGAQKPCFFGLPGRSRCQIRLSRTCDIQIRWVIAQKDALGADFERLLFSPSSKIGVFTLVGAPSTRWLAVLGVGRPVWRGKKLKQ